MSVEIPNSGMPDDDIFLSHPDLCQLDVADVTRQHNLLTLAPVLARLSQIPVNARLTLEEEIFPRTTFHRFIKTSNGERDSFPEWLWLADKPEDEDRLVLINGAAFSGIQRIIADVIKGEVGVSLFEFTKVDAENRDGAMYGGERLPSICSLDKTTAAKLIGAGLIGLTQEDGAPYWRLPVQNHTTGPINRAMWDL
jgi:hypothetical protein